MMHSSIDTHKGFYFILMQNTGAENYWCKLTKITSLLLNDRIKLRSFSYENYVIIRFMILLDNIKFLTT